MEIEQALESDLPEMLQLQHQAYLREAELLNDFQISPLTQTLEQVQQKFKNGIFLKA